VVDVPAIQAFDHELAREAEVLAHTQGLFIYILCREIFCDAAVVCIGQFCSVDLIIEEIVDVNVIHIALDGLKVDVLGLLLGCGASRLPIWHSTLYHRVVWRCIRIRSPCLMPILVFFFLLGIIFISLLQPWVSKYLRYGHSLSGI
jgi:hypothetical protein